MCLCVHTPVCLGLELGLHASQTRALPLSHSLQRMLFIFPLAAVATLNRFLLSTIDSYSIEIPSVLAVGYILPLDLIYYSQSSHLSWTQNYLPSTSIPQSFSEPWKMKGSTFSLAHEFTTDSYLVPQTSRPQVFSKASFLYQQTQPGPCLEGAR